MLSGVSGQETADTIHWLTEYLLRSLTHEQGKATKSIKESGGLMDSDLKCLWRDCQLVETIHRCLIQRCRAPICLEVCALGLRLRVRDSTDFGGSSLPGARCV